MKNYNTYITKLIAAIAVKTVESSTNGTEVK